MDFVQFDGNNSYQEDGHGHYRDDELDIELVFVSDGHGTCYICGKRSGHRARDILASNFTRIIREYIHPGESRNDLLYDIIPASIRRACNILQTEHFADDTCKTNQPCNNKGGITFAGIVRDIVTGNVLAFNLGDCRVHAGPNMDTRLLYNPEHASTDQDFMQMDSQNIWKKIDTEYVHKQVVSNGTRCVTFAGSLGDLYCPILKREPDFYHWNDCANKHIIIASDGLWDLLQQVDQAKYFEPYISALHKNIVNLQTVGKFVSAMIGSRVWDNVTIIYIPPLN